MKQIKDEEKEKIIKRIKQGMQPWEINREFPTIPVSQIEKIKREYLKTLTPEEQNEIKRLDQSRRVQRKIPIEEIKQLILQGFPEWEIQKVYQEVPLFLIQQIRKEFVQTLSKKDKEEIKTKTTIRRKMYQNETLIELICTNLSCNEILSELSSFQGKKITEIP